MSNKVLLISESTIKSNSIIADNCDGMYLTPVIQLAQDQRLQPLIGTPLYDKLRELIATNQIEQEHNIRYKELLDDYIEPFLLWAVTSEIQIPIHWKIRNAGIVLNNDQHFESSYMNNDHYLKEYFADKMNFYGFRLSDYLIANSNDYPEYYQWRSIADMPSNKNAYNTGMYLGSSHNCLENGDVMIIHTN